MADAITPKATKDENLAEARRWFDKALTLEKEGKSAKMIEMCVDRACLYDRFAFGCTA